MPDEVEVPLEHAHEHIAEAHEEHAEGHAKHHAAPQGERWIRYMAVVTATLAVIAAIGALQSGLLINEKRADQEPHAGAAFSWLRCPQSLRTQLSSIRLYSVYRTYVSLARS